MSTYRSTTLKLFDRNCPAALGFYEDGATADRDFMQPGIAAHAILQATTQDANVMGRELEHEECEVVADRVVRTLIETGRSFDGVPEPPMAPGHAFAGRTLALERRFYHPARPGPDAEVGLAIDSAGKPVAYDAPTARYKAIVDEIEVTTVGDEERSAQGVVIREYKSAWPTDESELDTLQTRGQAVLVAAHYGDAEVIVRTVVNLRTGQTFEREVYPGSDRALIDEWRAEIFAACDAADATREARPGVGCTGCVYVQECEAAWGALFSDEGGPAPRWAIAEAVREAYAPLARIQAKHGPVEIEGGTVGYHTKDKREPMSDAVRILAFEWFNVPHEEEETWCAQEATLLGLLYALRLGAGNYERAAKGLFPERGTKLERAEFLERVLTTTQVPVFGIERSPPERKA